MSIPDHAVYSEDAGCFISSKFQKLAEILRDYDPALEMRWIPPNARTSEDTMPYCIVHQINDKKPYVVLYFTESDDPELILSRIFQGDNKRTNVLEQLDRENAAREAFRLKDELDARLEKADLFHFLMTNRSKNTVHLRDESTGEKIKLDTMRRRIT